MSNYYSIFWNCSKGICCSFAPCFHDSDPNNL